MTSFPFFQLKAPESFILSLVTSDDDHDRTSRVVVTPWLKFLWETFRVGLDVIKNNNKVFFLGGGGGNHHLQGKIKKTKVE